MGSSGVIAATIMEVASRTRTTLRMSSTEGAVVRLNGEEVGLKRLAAGGMPVDAAFEVELQAGRNTLMLRMSNHLGMPGEFWASFDGISACAHRDTAPHAALREVNDQDLLQLRVL